MPDKLNIISNVMDTADKIIYKTHPKSHGLFYKRDKVDAVQRLINDSNTDIDYYFMLILSTIIASIGLIQDSAAVVIGAMLITPLITPSLALGLGTVTGNPGSIYRSAWALTKSIVLVLLVSSGLAAFLNYDGELNKEIIQRIGISSQYFLVAFFSGLAAAYSWIKPKSNSSLPGAAVSVALLPPLCVMGISLSVMDIDVMSGASNLFLINLAGIVLASTLGFSLFGFKSLKKVEEKEIQEELKE